MRFALRLRVALVLAAVLPLVPTSVAANGAPITGTVKTVDPAAGTLVVESTVRGRTRQVVIHVRPDSRIVRFVRSADASKPGFTEQAATLAELEEGWTVTVKTKHEGADEVAELIRVVHER